MNFREIKASAVEDTVSRLCVDACTVIREDVLAALKTARDRENEDNPREMLGVLVENAEIAKDKGIPICQDTGMAVVFVEKGEDLSVSGGTIVEAINRGVEKGYEKGHLRKSVVNDPLERKNTGTNTPAVIHIDPVPGDGLKITVAPKGFGSENKSAMKMLNPTAGPDEIVEFCVETVKKAGPDACPPYVLGIGIGGTMDSCALMAKKALLRPIDRPNPDASAEELERKIMDESNDLEIGTMGLGGGFTVIGVNIEMGPTHIAGLPVAVNLCCHALRSATAEV